MGVLKRRLKSLAEPLQAVGARVLLMDPEIRKRASQLRDLRVSALRTRVHGDYHLGQLLYTGKDFVIIDFEGEPARPLSERRIKRSPLRDVAGMLRSFHYASHAALTGQAGGVRPTDGAILAPWAVFWQEWVSASFLKEYLQTAAQGNFLPRSVEELRVLLDVLLLDKVVYELEYELNSRPDWVNIPLQGLLQLLEDSGASA
jgi:maltose alpha-D-glucosyltransferase/alpha-amylase